jgi:GT2 family glycosyltransferase/dTDP-4-dehydrorhamnose reductase
MPKIKSEAQEAQYSVSVVMPSYYTAPVLMRTINSVLSQPHLKELILVDNGNSDYVRGKIKQYATENELLDVISGQGNIGFARACNLGSHEAKGDYLLFLNPDCILPENAFEKAITALEQNEDAWVLGCKMVNSDGTEQKGNRRNLLTAKSLFSEWFGLHRFFDIPRFELSKTPPSGDTNFVPAICSAFMMMKRERFFEIGEMDENYFVKIEDLDLCFQVNQMGGKIIFVNSLEVIRYGSRNDLPRLMLNKHRAKGLAYYFRKNYNGAYFPGAITLICLVIYLRLFFQAYISFVRKIRQKFNKPFITNKEISCYKSFIQTYKEFEHDCKSIKKGSKYDISNHAPILITNAENQIGICILRRLLAADINVIALYKNTHIDIFHPRLLWVKSDIENKNFDLPADTKIKAVIYTSSISVIRPFIEKFTNLGAKRMVAFCHIINTKKHVLLEKDIARICLQKDIRCTILRTPIVYGVGSNSYFTPIYRFIKKFGRFPAKNTHFKIYAPIHADDLAISAIKILNFKETYDKNYNLVGSDKNFTYADLIEKIFTALNKEVKISNSYFWLMFYKFYSKTTHSKNINKNIQKYKEDGPAINSADAEKDFDFFAESFLKASNKDLGIDNK